MNGDEPVVVGPGQLTIFDAMFDTEVERSSAILAAVDKAVIDGLFDGVVTIGDVTFDFMKPVGE